MRDFKRSVIVAVAGFLAIGTVAILLWQAFRGPPEFNAYVGMTRSRIVLEWGEPTHEWDGHFGNPPMSAVEKFGPAKSLVFERFNGSLYMSLHEEGDQWVCFVSQWLPRGGEF